MLYRPAPELNIFAPRDPDIEAAVLQEFRKRKKVRIVEALEQADVVFIVEGGYGYFSSRNVGVGVGVDFPAGANTLLQLKAAAIPAPLFRGLSGRESMMRSVVRWRGREGDVTRKEFCSKSSLGKLVQRFEREYLRQP